MNRRTFALTLLIALLGYAPTLAQQKSASAPLKIGQVAPNFELSGKPKQNIKLSDYRKGSKNAKTTNKNVVLVFVRAHW